MQQIFPIFVISYNRGTFLQQTIDSCRRLSRSVDIIVHDNGSDDVETIEILSRLERDSCIVIRHPKITRADELNNTNDTIFEYFRNRNQLSNYVVTDCDIDISIAKPDVLDIYEELLRLYPAIQCVGPMLRIRDIPEHYPLFSHAMNRHIEQFWHRTPDWIETTGGPVATIECLIDTTFAVHRAGDPFHRQKNARRVYHPYEARHLDWYFDRSNYERTPYFYNSAAEISHWHNKTAHSQTENVQLRFNRFIYVDEDENGALSEKIHYLDRQSS